MRSRFNGCCLSVCLTLLTASALIAQSAPSALSVTPNAGSGSAQTFAFAFSDPAGATNIISTQIDVNSTLVTASACYFYYARAQNAIYLADDSGTWQPALTLGSPGTLQNSQCILNAGASSFSASGIDLTVNLALNFKAAFAGAKNLYMEAYNGLDSGWVQRGTWTATVGTPPTVHIDIPAPGSNVSGTITIAGWAIDNSSNVGSAIATVQVQVDGGAVVAATYGVSRPDVCAVYPSRSGCPNVGFSYSLDTATLAPGSHTITVSAVDSDGTPDTGSSSVTFTAVGVPPTVHIDSPASGSNVSGTITVAGWAIDNSSNVGSAIAAVRVQVDGGAAVTATYGVSRPDVCAAYPGRPGCPNVGFSYSLDTSTLTPGSHTITVSATDSDGTPDTGSSSVTVTAAVPVMPPMTGSATGAAPAAIDPTQLCAPNFGKVCTTFYSYITTTSPPTQIPLGMYGTSGTYTTGDSDVRSQFTNYTSNLIEDRNGQNLGLWCSDQQGHPVDAISIAETPAEARVPCANLNFAVSASNALYTLFGRHRAQAQFYDRAGVLQTYDSGIVTDYYSLGMVPAGRSSDFGPLQMGPLGDFRTAVGQTIAPNSDGVTVSYTGRTVGTISVHINVPYTALKGRHQLGFPANDNYGQPNPFELFATIVYDATPAITSVNPSSVAAQTPTTLTITGSGFGDHPTAFIAGSAYNLGVPSRNAQGQDVVSVSVNLPASLANSSIAVYLQSNGAGGQAFFQPQGTQNGTPRSNTVQVQVQPAPAPSILGISPISFHVGASGIPFVISGHNFGSGAPSLAFGSSGITYTITSSSDTQVSGTLSVPTTTIAGTVTVTLTPNGQSQTATTSITLTPAPPTISGAGGGPVPGGMWWFGPDFVPNNGYYNAVQLSVQPGPGGSAPSPAAPAVWATTANSNLVSLSCTDASCASVILTSLGPTLPCEDSAAYVKVRVTLSGVSSAKSPLVIDEPNSLETVPNADGNLALDLSYLLGGKVGYQSLIIYQVRSKCHQILIHVAVNEEFTAQGRYTDIINNWPFLANDDPSFLHFWDTDNGFGFDSFVDTLETVDDAPGGSLAPPPQIPGPLRNPPVPLSTVPLIWQTQVFSVGSITVGKGLAVQQDYQTSYQDNGRNIGAFKP